MDLKEIQYEDGDGIHVAGSCEHDTDPSSSIKGGEFLNELGNCYL